ncbi:MAG: helix-turn-helix domain-containing protein [Thermoguttaceae bacterium]|nr:helix-turn-helix domain-containing protein [Thermoguttaceae bacterium]
MTFISVSMPNEATSRFAVEPFPSVDPIRKVPDNASVPGGITVTDGESDWANPADASADGVVTVTEVGTDWANPADASVDGVVTVTEGGTDWANPADTSVDGVAATVSEEENFHVAETRTGEVRSILRGDEAAAETKKIGETFHHIHEIRTRKGISLDYCAKKIGISLAAARKQEKPTSNLSISQLIKWMDVLNVQLSEILGLEEGDLDDPIFHLTELLKVKDLAESIQGGTREGSIYCVAGNLITNLDNLIFDSKDVAGGENVGQAQKDRRRAAEIPEKKAETKKVGETFHDIRGVLMREGVTLANCAKKMGISLEAAKEEARPTSNLSIRQLRRWKRVLCVPYTEILGLNECVYDGLITRRAELLKAKKSAVSIFEGAREENTRREAGELIKLLDALDPDFKDIKGWNEVGQSHEARRPGAAVARGEGFSFPG